VICKTINLIYSIITENITNTSDKTNNTSELQEIELNYHCLLCNEHFATQTILNSHCIESKKHPIYFFGLIGAIVFVLASARSVASCYPSDKVSSDVFLICFLLLPLFNFTLFCCFINQSFCNFQKYENVMLPFCLSMFGAQMWVVQHLANDWLAGDEKILFF
jgi:hypothetical protein